MSKDVLPRAIRGEPGISYILNRTMMRPRDVILFANECIAKAVGKGSLTVQMITEAEGEYSRLRLRALGDEWFADYPNLMTFAGLLKGRRTPFVVRELSHGDCEKFCLQFEISRPHERDFLSELSKAFVECAIDAAEFWQNVVIAFYRVGLVGLKLDKSESVTWSRGERRSVSSAEVGSQTRVGVHKAFWRTLGIKER